MKKLKRIVIIIGATAISLNSLGRAFYDPDIGSVIVAIIIFAFFLAVSFFYLFESKIKATRYFRKISSEYLSRSVLFLGHEYEFSLILFYAIGSYLLLAIFIFAIFRDDFPYEKTSIGRYLFYVVFALLVFGATWLTRTIIRFYRKTL